VSKQYSVEDFNGDVTVPQIHAGGGGLGGLDGEPIEEPEVTSDYKQPEVSFTGPVKGPMVPANQPAAAIIEQIERQQPLIAPGDPTREQMHPAREGPRRIKPVKSAVIAAAIFHEETGWVSRQSLWATTKDFLRVLSPGNWLDLAVTAQEYRWVMTHPREPTFKANFVMRNVYPLVMAYMAVCMTLKQEQLAEK